MAAQVNMTNKDDCLPDLGEKIEENEHFGNDLEMVQYQNEEEQSQENSDSIDNMIINSNTDEVLAHSETDTYMTEEPDIKQEQAFLTISQGTNQIAVNDNGSIVYSDASFIDSIADQLTLKGGSQVGLSDGNTLYYHNADELETQYLQEGELIQRPMDGTGSEESNDTLLLNEQDVAISQDDENILETSNEASLPITFNSGMTLFNKADLKNLVTIQQDSRGVKRSLQPGSSKNVITKVFVQNTSKGPIVQKNIASSVSGRKMSLAQAQRIGLISPKCQQVLTTGGTSGRVMLKKVIPTSGSSVLVKPPAKILPAPGPRDRITFSGVRGAIPVSHPVRTNIPVSQLKTFLTSTSTQARPVTVTKTLGGMTVGKVDGRSPQKIYVRPTNVISTSSGQLRIPLQIGGKQQVQYVKLVNSPSGSMSGVTFETAKPKIGQSSVAVGRSIAPSPVVHKSGDALIGKRIFLTCDPDKVSMTGLQIKSNSSVPVSSKGKTYTAFKSSTPIKDTTRSDAPLLSDGRVENGDDNETLTDLDLDKENEEISELCPGSPQRLLEANGIRPKKPCNCTRSQCLKLYCECFANGEFCFQCNCNNCYNNIDHEEERQQAIKACLDRNPTAFRPKIQMADSDDEERRHNKGCNCKRSHCLKNYCECFEGKLTCGKYCKCLSCRNTEEEMAAWERGETVDSGDEERDSGVKGTPFMPQALAEALCQCILVEAESAERKGEDLITTEQRIIEEMGQRLVQIIGNRSKKDSR